MGARHVISSSAMSLDDDVATQKFKDYFVVSNALTFASIRTIEPDFEYANIFPGEHYRILSGLVEVTQPKTLIDIGTYRGCSARVMLDYGDVTSNVHTFDLYDYSTFDWTVLKGDDFNSGRLKQHLVDLSCKETFDEYVELLQQADFVMLDGPKNDVFEKTFLHLLKAIPLTSKQRWLFIDDIKFDNMQELWRSIQSPKLDLTSFGHFSGSGLVNISEGLVI